MNAPTEGNLGDLRTLCSDIDIEDYPFVDAMVFANLVKDDNGTIVHVAQGADPTASPDEEISGSGRQLHIGLGTMTGIFLMYIFVLF